MRYHELWLQRWFYSRFFVHDSGAPCPLIFSTPMDAFSLFSKLWADEANPFAYLLNLKDDAGTPLYEPHPSPVRYPLISVMRRGIKLRPYQNFSTHRWRHVNWPTVSDTEEIPGKEQIGNELTHCDLGNVTVSRMPMAFDYKFQVDHYCLRPDTQARYIEKLLNQFWRTGGGVLQTWMDIEYPGWGTQYIRIYVDGEIDQSAPDDATVQDHTVEHRTTFTLVVEGFSIDVAYETHPALWKLILTSARLEDLDRLLMPTVTVDLRTEAGTNLVLDERPDIPMVGTCQAEGRRNAYTSAGTFSVYFGDPTVPSTPSDTVVVAGAYSYGIASTGTVGIPRFE